MPGLQIIMPNAASPTDRYNELLALMDGDRELLLELIDVFLEDAPQRVAADPGRAARAGRPRR